MPELMKLLRSMEPRLMLPLRKIRKIPSYLQSGRILQGVGHDPRLHLNTNDLDPLLRADDLKAPKDSVIEALVTAEEVYQLYFLKRIPDSSIHGD